MKCFTKISLVLLSCFSLSNGAVIPRDNSRNVDLTSFFDNLLEQKTPATPLAKEVDTVNTQQNEDVYTQDDIRKYTKFLLNFVNPGSDVQQPQQPAETAVTTTATTTTAVTATANAETVLSDIKELSSELDQIKERRVDEIDQLIDIIKNVTQRLEVLEETVEQSLVKQEPVDDTVADTKEVDLNNAEVDGKAQVMTPINEADLKYAAIFNAFNKKNEEKIASMQENQIKLLQEIKELIANNTESNENIEKTDIVEVATELEDDKESETKETEAVEDVNEKEIKPEDENVNAAPPPETSEEAIIEQKNNESEEFEKLYKEINDAIADYKDVVSKKDENVNSDEQFTKAAMIRDKTKNIKQYINKLASLAQNDEQKNKLKEINDSFENVESDHIEKVSNDDEIAQDENEAKEAAKENAKSNDNPNVVSIDHVKKILNEVASSTINDQQVDEVRRIIKEIQLNEQVETVEKEASEVNEEKAVADALFKVSSKTTNEEQVEEVRKFIKSIEAKALIDDNLKKDEVIRKLIFDISANTTNEDQVHQVQRIIEKIQLYNKFAEEKQQEREDNVAFGNEMAEEIQKSPEEISNDLKVLLVNLVNNAKTEEEAANVANIINQIKKHDELIKEKSEQDKEAESYAKVPNIETYMVDLDDGSSNQIYLKEDQDFITAPTKDEVPVIDLEEGIDEEEGSGKGLYVLGAFGVIAIAGAGFSYRSKAKKLNDEFPFSDSNLPFSNSMNGLVVDKNFLLRKNSIPKPEHIVNNDAVIRPSQPSWATSMLMDENNKKGLKENIQITEDPEELLDEQLREIENKEKVIVKTNIPSVVITIDDKSATTEVTEKPKKPVKKPKLRRSMSHISLDKKVKEDLDKKIKEDFSEKNRKKSHKKKSRKSKLVEVEKKIEDNELDEETELSLNTSFIFEAPSLVLNETELETDKITSKKNILLNAEKPKVPKRISSCLPENNDILPALAEEEEEEKEEKSNENSEISQDFAKELMEDYNKKFGEIEKEN